MSLNSPARPRGQGTRELAQNTLFVFAFFAGGIAASSAVFLLHDTSRHTLASEAMSTWQSIDGKLTQLEPFVRKSSFYYRVQISYRQNDAERLFSESWIPAEWWDEGTGAASVGSSIALAVDPNNPDRAMWNPRIQAARLETRIATCRSTLMASCLACGALLLGARVATGWGRPDIAG